jgi:hypothetical protein
MKRKILPYNPILKETKTSKNMTPEVNLERIEEWPNVGL